MPYTTTDLAAIDRAIASGVRSVTIGSDTVIYNTGDSLMRARQTIINDINRAAAQATKTQRPKARYIVQTGRGYE